MICPSAGGMQTPLGAPGPSVPLSSRPSVCPSVPPFHAQNEGFFINNDSEISDRSILLLEDASLFLSFLLAIWRHVTY